MTEMERLKNVQEKFTLYANFIQNTGMWYFAFRNSFTSFYTKLMKRINIAFRAFVNFTNSSLISTLLWMRLLRRVVNNESCRNEQTASEPLNKLIYTTALIMLERSYLSDYDW